MYRAVIDAKAVVAELAKEPDDQLVEPLDAGVEESKGCVTVKHSLPTHFPWFQCISGR